MRSRLTDPEAISLLSLDSDPQYRALMGELAALEERQRETTARRDRAMALRKGAVPGRSAAARAADLVRGAIIPGTDPDREIAAADEEHAVLTKAIGELSAKIADRRGDLSLAACRKVQAEHSAALQAALRAIGDLHAAFQVAAGIRARVHAGGFDVLAHVLPDSMPPGVLALDPNNPNSQLNLWLGALECSYGYRLR